MGYGEYFEVAKCYLLLLSFRAGRVGMKCPPFISRWAASCPPYF